MEESSRRTVFIVNKTPYDFSEAEEYGRLAFLTEGAVRRYDVEGLFNQIEDGLADAGAEDFLVISSLPILTNLATAILARRFGRVNYLLLKNNRYICKTVEML